VRLSSIKLAGFKSFVDPTHFQIPGQLVGVVGPNGCGKSNVMDAVRWVLGESRASELRGDSMQDVIFNGSTQRKPAGRASVELIFENNAGRMTGPWSQYAEIAVKRILTRDGGSSYYINNQAVRRRDIQDMFMGTGLGPRAYAIIGQGMIARIIESKPDELRIFLEEAAGVSKYKERRRETENRLADTRDNLTRVEDILRELSTNLEKLEQQAAVATEYQTLQEKVTEQNNLLHLVRKQEALAEQNRHHTALNTVHTQLEEQTAKLRQLESELEVLRARHYDASDTVNEAQEHLYEANAVVSRLEAEAKFTLESRQRIEMQISAIDNQHSQWSSQAQQAESELLQQHQQQQETLEKHVLAQEALTEHNTRMPILEDQWRTTQMQLKQQQVEINKIEQQLKLEAMQQRHIDQVLQQLQTRQAKLTADTQGLHQPNLNDLQALEQVLDERQAQLTQAQQTLDIAQARLQELEAAKLSAQEQALRETTMVTRLEERLQTLKALQERLQVEGKVMPWLEQHELNQLPRLWKSLHIEPGWENALEAVLRERLLALEISDLHWTQAFAQAESMPPAKLAFYTRPGDQTDTKNSLSTNNNDRRLLLSLIKTGDAALQQLLQSWLANIYLADNFNEAMQARQQLQDNEWLVVREGHLLSRHAIQFYAQDSEQEGMLAREQEIENLQKQTRAQHLLSEQANSLASQTEVSYQQAYQAIRDTHAEIENLRHEIHALQLEHLSLNKAVEQFQQQNQRISEELSDLTEQIETQHELRLQTEENFQQYDMQLAELQARYQDDHIVFETLDEQLRHARDTLRTLERQVQETEFMQRNIAQRIAELERIQRSAHEQKQRLEQEREQSHTELAQLSDELNQAALQEALTIRADKEEIFTSVRASMEELAHSLRTMEDARLNLERSLQPIRDRITELQLKEQAARLAQEQYAEQLQIAQVDESELAQKITPEMKPNYLQTEINRLQSAITALGPVNMAALEELKAARERKTFLTAQLEDLTKASHTLEDAIRKIDNETRTLLQDTFDQVNLHFGQLFPELFGGGQARLVMTGEEILDAGVQVLAQPPGKKNSSIQLLSGGEKALTAIALVFSMFLLNPAPFCLLDEVDAPLDDANTERYAKMVKRMSDKTQFVFISHNKIAMAIAEQLIGVTMQEQGVSRIVAVDMARATSVAEAA
jgi:chromosome segregation protein